MTPSMTVPLEYDRRTIWFHWVSAVLLIAQWPIGKIMVLPSPPDRSDLLYAIHVAIGLLVAGITLARVVWHFRRPAPGILSMPKIERIAYRANHYLLYGLLGVLSFTGIAILLAASGFSAFELVKNTGPHTQHEIASTVFAGLFLMHFTGAVVYQARKGQTLRRMGVRLR
ncbi:MAG: cytochrome b/b6 domain-containing protein [Actinomycetota bacterium]|nr:cytochrome b/b6 domain-containing protein [Actinomycetota bacterium]